VCGAGAVGSRAARQLASSAEVSSVVLIDRATERAEAVARSLGPLAVHAPSAGWPWPDAVLADADVLIVAAPIVGGLTSLAPSRVANAVGLDVVRAALTAGVAVVAVADGITEVEALLDLDAEARRAGVPIVVGAGMAPGLTDVLALHAAAAFDEVEEVHVAKAGTGGPACASQHHRALGEEAVDWRDGTWIRRPGGSGRELCWFPDPVGGRDCYRAGLADARLLMPAFPGVRRVTARVAATRRDRLTAALPMLRRPHPEGGVGAVRVEVRGRRGGRSDTAVLGAIDRLGVAAGAVAAVSALWAVTGRLGQPRAAGLASLVDEPGVFLAELARRGVKAAAFEGADPG